MRRARSTDWTPMASRHRTFRLSWWCRDMTSLPRKRSTHESPTTTRIFVSGSATRISSAPRKMADSKLTTAGSMTPWRDDYRIRAMSTISARRIASVLNWIGRGSPGTGSSENPATHYGARRAPRAQIPAAQLGSPAGSAGRILRQPGQVGQAGSTRGRPGALRAGPGRAGRLSSSHAGERCGLSLYRRTDRDRNLAGHEHCGSAQDPGLRADGAARLRTHFCTAHLAFPAGTRFFAAIRTAGARLH